MALALVMTMTLSLPAQETGKQKDGLTNRTEKRIEAMEKRLLLDDKTAAEFAPLYKEYLEALGNCRVKADEKATGDEAILARLKAKLSTEQAKAETKLKYVEKFSKILTARQVELLFDTPRMNRPATPRSGQTFSRDSLRQRPTNAQLRQQSVQRRVAAPLKVEK